VAAAVEEDHERQRTALVALRGQVDLVRVRRARVVLSRREHMTRDGALWHAGLRLRIGSERVVDRRQPTERRLRWATRRLDAEPGQRGKDHGRGRVSHRFEGIFGLSPRSVISLVRRSTARSTGRLSAIEIGVRPAAFSSSSLAPRSARNWITSHTSGCVRPLIATAVCITVLPAVVTTSTCGPIANAYLK